MASQKTKKSFCLIPSQIDSFKKALKFKEIKIDDLISMSTNDRINLLKKYAGDNAKDVNYLFEKKLVLKNWEKGVENWVKQLTESGRWSPTKIKEVKEALEKFKIAKKERIFKPKEGESILQSLVDEQDELLNNLVDRKLGIGVSLEEAKTITMFSKTVDELKLKIPSDSPIRSKERLEYGTALVAYKKYVGNLKESAEKLTWKEWVTSPKAMIVDTAGMVKSTVATLDNSFFGRQGIKVLYNNPTIWGRNFLKSWGDIKKGLKDIDAMDAIRADVWSRPDALNGNYSLSKVDIGIDAEEAFPSQFLEKIRGLSRLFKASENAYNGAALRIRADLADKMFEVAGKQGVDTTNKFEMESIGKLVNSMTGRGSIGKLNAIGSELNVALFSIKFLKSNFDTLTAHLLDKNMSKFGKKQAATNLAKIVGSVAGILTVAETLYPGSVEKDPRSSDFGKIKIGDRKFDITGGMGSMAVLATRLAFVVADFAGIETKGEIKTSSGVVKKLNTGEYGAPTGWDLLFDFSSNKLSPLAGVFRDIAKGEVYGGAKATPSALAANLIVPIPIQNAWEMRNDPNGSNILLAMIADGLGFSVSESMLAKTDWNQSTSQEMIQFKEKFGQKEFDVANDKYNKEFVKRLDKLQQNEKYKAADEEEKADYISKLKATVKEEVFDDYNFKAKRKKPKKLDIEL